LRYFLDPFGCAKNQVDAEIMMSLLNESGWSSGEGPEEADLIIVNSCAFIEKAKRESLEAVLAWRKEFPQKKILLAGCLSQRYARELSASLPEEDALLGSGEFGRIAEAAAALMGAAQTAPGNLAAQQGGPPGTAESVRGGRPLLGFPGSAYVKISEGCDNHCSFCAIPLIRGGLVCRDIPDAAAECEALLKRGVRELCLIGQDLAAYKPGLSKLLEELSKLRGDFWVRLLYLHPDHFPLDILERVKSDPRLLPYFDIPFQHGSQKILSAMNRRGDAASYLKLLEQIRNALPDAVIRSTFLTGFPGETEADFRELLDFQKAARFDWLGVFAYSREEGTAAYTMKDRVDKKTAAARKARIEETQLAITEDGMNRFIGRDMDVLVEEILEAPRGRMPVSAPCEAASATLYLGRLYCQAPEVDGAAVIHASAPLVPGSFVPCRVFAKPGFDLEVLAL
jgi:ribosomal protein S12 methylthiotransferase